MITLVIDGILIFRIIITIVCTFLYIGGILFLWIAIDSRKNPELSDIMFGILGAILIIATTYIWTLSWGILQVVIK